MSIHEACANGAVADVAALLDGGTAIDERDGNGWTPLHVAATFGHVEVAALLLDHGAELDAIDPDGVTALHQAAHENRVAMLGLLLDRGALREARTLRGRTPLHVAADRGHLDCIAELLARGADVNARALDGGTPLHAAAWARAEAIAVLLGAGADANAAAAGDVTPLAVAAREGFTRCVAALLDGGARIDAANTEGGTPLFVAAAHARREVLALLVERGADLDAPLRTGGTARKALGAALGRPLPTVAIPVVQPEAPIAAVDAIRFYFERKRGGHPLVRDLLSAPWWVLHRPEGPPGSARGAPVIPDHGPSLLLFHDRAGAERFQRELPGLPSGLACSLVDGAALFALVEDAYEEIVFDPPLEQLPFVFYKRGQLPMLRRAAERLRLEAELADVPSRAAITRAVRHQPYAVVRVMDSVLALRHDDRTSLVVISSDQAAEALTRALMTFAAAAPNDTALWARLGKGEAQTVALPVVKIFGLRELPVDGAILDPAGPDRPIVLSIEDCERIALE